MPFGSVTLQPGVNVERTPTLLTAGFVSSQLVRFRDQLVQKYGGWSRLYPFALNGVPRDLHAWEDLSSNLHLLVGTTTTLGMITGSTLVDITPRTFTSNFAPNFTTTIGSNVVSITDSNVNSIGLNDTILFNTPVSVGGLILNGIYPVYQTLGGSSYQILAASNATANVSNGGAVPSFTTTSGSSIVQVTLNGHGITQFGAGIIVSFPVSTTGNGVTIFKDYTVVGLNLPNSFNINATTQATASSSFSMNAGNTQIVYYLGQGPPPAGAGYGVGAYGSGGYGLGTGGGGSATTGSPITATDWTSDNWGEFALACPQGGGVYFFDPTGGFLQADILATAPPFNGGIFVSTSEQILVCWASTVNLQMGGIDQDPLLVRWSTVGDFTQFTALANQNQAGSFRIPKGTTIRGGMATPNQNLIWTELDCWAMNYLGPPFVFGFNEIGSGAGLISSHAAQR